MPIKIATWNVNSVRIRLDNLARLVEAASPDVICLQEIKVVDELFPREALAAMGYPHQMVRGMKGYNGVAILSRLELTGTGTRDWCGRDDSRHIFATLPDGSQLHNFYVPAGGDVADPEVNDKFAHKLQFLTEMARWFRRKGRAGPGGANHGSANQGGAARLILVGDLNIAPLETDVWSHKQLLKVVSHTPVEIDHLDRLQRSLDWVDAVRHFIPPSERLYSWWSYRSRDWSDSDRGRRLDHVWVTPEIEKDLIGAEVLRAARGWANPSDHAPVIVTIAPPG